MFLCTNTFWACDQCFKKHGAEQKHFTRYGTRRNFDNKIQELWLLNTLSDSWKTLRVYLTNSIPGVKVIIEYAKSGVLNEEVRRKFQGSSSQADIFVIKDQGRDRIRGSRNKGKCRSKSRSEYENYSCYHCSKKEHTGKFCYKLKQDNKERKKVRI